MKELLASTFIILLFLTLSIWAGQKACKESRNCLIGIWLSILGLIGSATGLGGWQLYGLTCIITTFISIPLFIIGLFLVIKNRKYINDWIDHLNH